MLMLMVPYILIYGDLLLLGVLWLLMSFAATIALSTNESAIHNDFLIQAYSFSFRSFNS